MVSNFWDLNTQEQHINSIAAPRLKSWKGSAKIYSIFYYFDKDIPMDNISASEGGLHDNNTLNTPFRNKRYE